MNLAYVFAAKIRNAAQASPEAQGRTNLFGRLCTHRARTQRRHPPRKAWLDPRDTTLQIRLKRADLSKLGIAAQ